MAEVGEAIERRVHALGLNHAQAADRAGVSDETWRNVRTGKHVRGDTIAKIARALQWPSDFLDRIDTGEDLDEWPIEDQPTDTSRIDKLEADIAEFRRMLAAIEARLDDPGSAGRSGGTRPPRPPSGRGGR